MTLGRSQNRASSLHVGPHQPEPITPIQTYFQNREAEVAIIERDKAAKDAAQKIKTMDHEMARHKEAYETGAERVSMDR